MKQHQNAATTDQLTRMKTINFWRKYEHSLLKPGFTRDVGDVGVGRRCLPGAGGREHKPFRSASAIGGLRPV